MFTSYPVVQNFQISTLYTMFVKDYGADFSFPGEFHDFWEVVHVLKGRICVSGDNRVYTLGEGDVIFHKPMENHKFYVDDPNGARLLIASFSMQGDGCEHFKNKVFTLDAQERLVVQGLLSYLAAYESDGQRNLPLNILSPTRITPPNTAMIASYLTQLLLLLERNGCGAVLHSPRESTVFSQAADYMEAHLGDTIGCAALARRFNVSLSGLKRLFRQYADMGIHEYFMHLKLRHAITLLEEGHSVTDTASALGFSSQAYFSRAFTRAMGYAPSAVRTKSRYIGATFKESLDNAPSF